VHHRRFLRGPLPRGVRGSIRAGPTRTRPEGEGESRVGPLPHLSGWWDVEYRDSIHAPRMVERQAIGDTSATVVSGNREALVASRSITATMSRVIAAVLPRIARSCYQEYISRGGDPFDVEIGKLTRPSDQTFSSRNLPRRPASTATEISLPDGIDCPSIGHVDCRQRAAVYATDRPQPI
jgi:hypothetical protein